MTVYTEEEAHTKWCPIVRMVPQAVDPQTGAKNSLPTSGNLFINEDGSAFRPGCIGSACMMWNWVSEDQHQPKRGYCGLSLRRR